MDCIIIFILGAAAYRAQGSKCFGMTESSMIGSLPWAVLMTAITMLVTADLWMVLTFPLWLLGVAPGYNLLKTANKGIKWTGYQFPEYDVQFNLEKPENRKPLNYLYLSVRGAFISFPQFIVTAIGGGFLGGFMLPVFYLVGIPIQNLMKRLNIRIPYLSGFSEIGEALLGGMIGLGVYVL
jgi:hypothetical protein